MIPENTSDSGELETNIKARWDASRYVGETETVKFSVEIFDAGNLPVR